MAASETSTDVCLAWWENDAAVQRLVCDLIGAELCSMRPTGPTLPPLPWRDDMLIGHDLGADSLELMALASALAEAVHMHESGIEDYLLARQTIGDWVSITQTSLSRFSTNMTFRTSGSTGIPKACMHPLESLWQEVGELMPLVQRPDRIFSAVPSHHIYGFLFTILLPHRCGLAADAVINLRSSSTARLAYQLRAGDLVVGHPEFWRAAARTVPAFAPGVTGVTSTAPCPDSITAAIEQAGLTTLLQVYGSSETAGIGWRDDAAQPYTLFSYWHRDEARTGRIVRDRDPGTHFACQDTLLWLDERRFMPTGRVDEAVQVGGINVFPQRVRREILQHPAVLDASVRLMHPAEGNRLKAFIVPRDANSDLQTLHLALDAWLRDRLSAPERPRALSFGAILPTDARGKLADWRLVDSNA